MTFLGQVNGGKRPEAGRDDRRRSRPERRRSGALATAQSLRRRPERPCQGVAGNEGARAPFDSLKAQLRNPPVVSAAEPRTPEATERLQRRNPLVAKALSEVSEDDLFRYWTGMVRNYSAFIGHDFTPRLRELAMPVLVIHGSGDTVIPLRIGKALHEAVAGSEVCELDGAGHGVFDYPRGQDALRTWVRKVGRLALPA